jgi:hypothetical protein
MRSFLLLSILCGWMTCTLAQAQAAKDSLVWATSEASFPGIQADVTNLYQTLYQLKKAGGTVLTRKALLKDESGKSIQELVAREGLYIGDGENFPRALDILLCDHNPTKCHVTLRRPGEFQARWFRVRNEEIFVPDLKLDYDELIQVYSKKKGDRVSTIVVNDRAGCTTYDAKCQAKIKHLNIEPEKLQDDYQGQILIPSASYSTKLPLAPPTAEEIAKGGIVTLGVSRSTANRFLGNVIVAPTSVKVNQTETPQSAPDLTRQKLLALIKYRRVEREGFERMAIGLIDSKPYLDHCDFDFKQQFKEQNQLREIDPEPQTDGLSTASVEQIVCGEQSKLEVQKSEHGTHLLGLWFSRREAKTGEGMLPYDKSYLGVGAVDYSKMTQPSYYKKVGSLIQQMAGSYKVINLSWGVPASIPLSGGVDNPLVPRKDPVGEAIMVPAATGRSNVLFVAAAGNDDRLIKAGACDITPLCGPNNRTHVLTVAALTNDDDDPDIGSRSNFGRPVDIGVPAVNLWSTIRGHRTGRASGSSQAAATAAAAASMLMYATDMKPQPARNRIIYTSDLTPKLQKGGGKLFGGRLNFAQALDVDVAKAVFGQQELKGRVDFSVPKKANARVILSIRSSEGSANIPIDLVKRLHRNRAGDPARPFTVFYISKANSELLRFDGALTPDTLSLNIDVTRSDEAMVSKTVGDLDDYIAAVVQQVQ